MNNSVEQIEYCHKLYTEMELRIKTIETKLVECEELKTKVLYFIMKDSFNASEGYNYSLSLKEILIKIEDYKTEKLRLEKLCNENDKAKLESTINKILDKEKKHINPKYNPRRIKNKEIISTLSPEDIINKQKLA